MSGIDGLDWSVFGGNPVPGDPDAVRATAGGLRDLADTAGQQATLLQATGGDVAGVWQGPAAERFHPRVTTLVGQLQKLATSHRDAADALDGYWPKLADAQQLAVRARAKAVAATAALGQAGPAADAAASAARRASDDYAAAVTAAGAPGAPPTASGAAAAAKVAYAAASAHASASAAAVAAAQADLDAAHRMRDAAVTSARDASTLCAAALRSASSAGIQNPHHSWWQTAVSDLTSVATGAWHQVEQFGEGVWHGVEGPAIMLAKLADPLTAPGELEALAKGLAYGVTHPLQFGEAMLDWKDLSSGNIARWLGNLAPAVAAAVFTGGAGDVADGMSALNAVDRAGLTADDITSIVAAGDEGTAARVLMRSEEPVPGRMYAGRPPQLGRDMSVPYDAGTQWAKEQGNFTDGVATKSSPMPETWSANVHDGGVPLYGDEGGGRSLQWGAKPTDLLGITDVGAYTQRYALLPEWGARDELTMLHLPAGSPGPLWEGGTAAQVSQAGATYAGGGQQLLVHTIPSDAAVWTGPAPWAATRDLPLAARGAATLGAAAGATRAATATSGGR